MDTRTPVSPPRRILAAMDEELHARVTRAVEELHADLALWLGTEAPTTVYDRFLSAQHPDFTMVDGSGAVVGRQQLATGLARAGNARPGLRIAVDDITVVTAAGNLAVVRFLETHHHDGTAEARRVTAVLVADRAHDERLRWLTVHETQRR